MFIQPVNSRSVQVPAVGQDCARRHRIRKMNQRVVIREIKTQGDPNIHVHDRWFYGLQSFHSHPLRLNMPPFTISTF